MDISKNNDLDDFFEDFNLNEFEEDIKEEDLNKKENIETVNQIENKDTLNKPFIPKNDYGYTEIETVDIENQEPIKVIYEVPPKPVQKYEIPMWETINNFEIDSWNPNNMGFKTGFDSIDKAFDGGLKSGFIVIAADSNIGKSAIMSQLAWQVATLNDDAYVMDFSLDDPMPDKLARIVGCGNKVIINAVKNPNGYKQFPLMIARRKTGINNLRKVVDRYRAYDSTFSNFIEDIEEEVKRILIEFEAKGINKKPVVFIDNLHDLCIKNNPSLLDKQKYDVIAQWASDLAIQYDIPVVCTAELKKINGTRRPELDDIRECVKIKYEAKAILLVYNEVHYKGEAANIYYLMNNNPLKQPVLEIHFAKNKISSFKGRIFFEFFPNMAFISESDDKATKTYNNLIFGN